MKQGGPEHPKVVNLGEWIDEEASVGSSLIHPRTIATGILEKLWHACARYTPQGNIGRYKDRWIAEIVGWRGDATRLVNALVECGFLERHPEHRLIVHDWAEHADDGVHIKLARGGQFFADGSKPKLTRLSKNERAELEAIYEERTESAQKAHGERIKSALPGLAWPGLAKPSHGLVEESAQKAHAPTTATPAALSATLANQIESLPRCRDRGSLKRREAIEARIAMVGAEEVQRVVSWMLHAEHPVAEKHRGALARFPDALLPSDRFDRFDEAKAALEEQAPQAAKPLVDINDESQWEWPE